MEGEKLALTDVAPIIGELSGPRKFERQEFRERQIKTRPETQTGRRFEASACWNNWRVKQSLLPLNSVGVRRAGLYGAVWSTR
jgi:hypothetical protein